MIPTYMINLSKDNPTLNSRITKSANKIIEIRLIDIFTPFVNDYTIQCMLDASVYSKF